MRSMPALEESEVEFMDRWRAHAAEAFIYPQPEGSPLIEARVGGRVFYLLDRTGPYTARRGDGLLIVNPVSESVSPADVAEEQLNVVGVSRLQATGRVLEVSPGVVVVRARAPLVVGVLDRSWRDLRPGDWVSLDSAEPVHGFYVGAKRAVRVSVA